MSHPIERHCPSCGAEPGQPCLTKRGRDRISYHRLRGSRFGFLARTSHRRVVESPLEDLLVGNILGWLDHHGITDAELATQVPVGPYRADILIEVAGRKLIVECDGSAFHETREAVQHDKRRDRYCALQGITVLRFTGKEINRDPRGCAAQVGVWIRAQR